MRPDKIPPGTAPIDVLAESSPSNVSKTPPVAWTTKHERARIVGLTLGHDERVHDHRLQDATDQRRNGRAGSRNRPLTPKHNDAKSHRSSKSPSFAVELASLRRGVYREIRIPIPTIAVLGTSTQRPEHAFIAEAIQREGFTPLLIAVGSLNSPTITPLFPPILSRRRRMRRTIASARRHDRGDSVPSWAGPPGSSSPSLR